MENSQGRGFDGIVRPIIDDDFEMIYDGDGELAGNPSGYEDTPDGSNSGSTRGTTMGLVDTIDDGSKEDISSVKATEEDEVDEICLRQEQAIMFESEY